MKFSTVASTIVGTAIYFASSAVADVDFFNWPSPHTQFRAGSCIPFLVDDMPDGDDNDIVFANLYKDNGAYVKTIRSWPHKYADDDNFGFTWCSESTLSPGRYFVEIFSTDDDDDDVSRSFLFNILGPNSAPTNTGFPPRRPTMRPSRSYPRAPRGFRYRRYDKRSLPVEETN